MESTQNKIYEIEESALVDQNIKNNMVDEDLAGEENKNGSNLVLNLIDYDLYSDQFDDGATMGNKTGKEGGLPKSGISVEISMGNQGASTLANQA